MKDNNLHNDELDNSFEKDIESAFILNERKALKSAFKNIEKENDLDEKEIETAFVLKERKRLKEQFKEIDEFAKIEAVTKRANWKRFSIAASIIGLVVLTSIWILKYNVSAPDKELVNLQTDKIEEIIVERPVTTLKIEAPARLLPYQKEKEYYSLLNNSRFKYSNTKTLDIRKIRSFGFGSNKVEKIKVINYNIDSQILLLNEFEKKHLLDSNNYLNNKIKYNVDSITALKNKYTFDLITLNIYNINSDDIEVYYLDKKYYLRNSTFYYALSRTKKPIVLKKLNNLDTIKQLVAL